MPLNRPLLPTVYYGEIFKGLVPVKANIIFWVICLTIVLRLKFLKFATKNRLTTLILAKIFLKLIELFYELNPGVYWRVR